MGNDSINLGLENIWRSWFVFRKDKCSTAELHNFQYYLEKNLFELFRDLNDGRYRHGGYKKFVVSDNKRREISVASLRDRIVHRLVYDYLVSIYDKTFIYDAWSCRKKKGLLGAIERAQKFLHSFPNAYVRKCDMRKFFDSVDQKTLLKILSFRIKDAKSFWLLEAIIRSFAVDKNGGGGGIGIPIGNLTSQIFANIYLNEFDHFVKHILKLRINSKSDKVFKVRHGLKFLGVVLWPCGRKLNKRNMKCVREKLTLNNAGSYYGILKHHANYRKMKEFHWGIFEKIFKYP